MSTSSVMSGRCCALVLMASENNTPNSSDEKMRSVIRLVTLDRP